MKLGGVKFFVKGVNQERAFTTLAQIAPLYALKRTSPTNAVFCASIKNEKLITRKLQELCITIENKKRFGILNQVLLFFKRIGILSAIGFCFAVQIALGCFVFNVKIFGNEKILNSEIFSVLEKNNFTGFVFKSSINSKQVEKIIMKEFDNISLVSVIIKGNTLVISIKEKVINDEYENVDSFAPLVSQYDGLITNINLISGTLNVKNGQIVKYGDTLVMPYIIDSSGQKRPVKAEAEITARVWYVGKQTHFAKKLQTVKTGKVERYVNLTFLGLNLTSNFQKEPSFSSFETVKNTTCISKNNILPIYRQEILYYETKQILVEENFDDVKENILQKAKEMALNLVGKCDIIKREFYSTNSQNEITFVEYVVEVERRIDAHWQEEIWK